MQPYYICPFEYYRNSMNIPGAEAVLPMGSHNQPGMQQMLPATQPMVPFNDMMQPMMPVAPMQNLQPMAPIAPMQNMQPIMPVAPMQNMQPMMPIAPMQNIQPMMPIAPMQNMQPLMPIAPMQNMQPMMPMMNPYGNYPMMPGMDMGTPGLEPAEDMLDPADAASMAAEANREPLVSNNPPVTRITLFKEQTAYPNYGNPSGNADILYKGDRGVWTFQIPASLFQQGNWRGELVVRAVLDDHYNTPANRYSARITINNDTVHTGRVPLEHGAPSGGRFTNWKELTFRINNIRRNNRVVIVNTSENIANDDWIAFDWMELRLFPR